MCIRDSISTNAVCGEIVQDLYIDIDATEVVAAFDAPATAIVNEAIDFTNNSTVSTTVASPRRKISTCPNMLPLNLSFYLQVASLALYRVATDEMTM